MSSTKSILIEQAVQGMILACKITDRHGNILLPDNTILTQAMIGSIKRHGVAEISVESNSDDEQSASDLNPGMNLEAKIKRIDQLFMLHENEPANLQLKRYLINFISKGAQ